MARIGSIWIDLNVDVGRISAFHGAANTVDRDSRRMRTSLNGTTRSVQSLQQQMNRGFRSRMFGQALSDITRTRDEVTRLRAAMMGLAALSGGGFTAALGAQYLIQTADRARLLSNQLRTVTDGNIELAATEEKLYRLSQRTRSSFDSTVKVYARTARATEHLNLSQEKLLRLTETVQKAFAIGGASQAEATGAAIQLSQGIASDRFSGEEFRSIAENAPVLLRGMAESLDINIGKLREMAHAGELTADVVTKAIIDASQNIDTEFDKTVATVGQAMTRLDNAFLMYIGDVDESYGVTRRLSLAISNLAGNLDEVGQYAGLALAGGAALAGGRLLSGAIGGRVDNFSAMKKERREALDNLREQRNVLQQQGAQIKQQIASLQQKQVAIVANGHAIGTTARQQHLSNVAAERNLAKINDLRRQGVVISQAQVAVTNQVAMAQRRASAAATAFQMARNVGGGLLGLMGGWTGVAFTAAIAGAIMYGREVAEAAERTERLKKELRDLGLMADDAADSLDGTTESLEDLAADELRQKIREIKTELDRLKTSQNIFERIFNYDEDSLGNVIDALRQIRFSDVYGTASVSDADLAAAAEMEELVQAFIDGKIEAEEVQARLNVIAETELSEKMDDLIGRTREAIPFVDALGTRLEEIEVSMNATNVPTWLQETINDAARLEAALESFRNGQSFFEGRMAELRVGGFEAEVQERADSILKEAEERDLLITRLQAERQARDELLQEKRTTSLDDSVSGFVDRVVGVESGGDRFAKNPDSTATGLGQFIESTWLRLFREHFPDRAHSMSKEAILALRTDAAISRRLIEAYARENAAVLQQAGVAVDEAALQLSHFLGAGDAVKVLKAAPGTPVQGLVDQDSINANPTILGGGATVDDVIGYAQKRAGVETALTREIDLRDQHQEMIRGTIEALRMEVQMTELEVQSLGRTEVERLAALRALEIEQNLKEQGIEITRKLREEIEKEAQAWAQATVGRDNAVDFYEEVQAAQEEALRLQKDMASDFFGGMLRDLQNGVSAAESLEDAFARLASQLIDMAMNSAINDLFNSLNSKNQAPAAGSSGGGGGSWIGAVGNIISGFFGFDEGGYTGHGSPQALAGYVHAGEYVFDAESVRAAGVRNLMALHENLKGYDTGGFVGSAQPSWTPNLSDRDVEARAGSVEIHNHFDGTVTRDEVVRMARESGEQAVRVVKDGLPSWQREINTFGVAS